MGLQHQERALLGCCQMHMGMSMLSNFAGAELQSPTAGCEALQVAPVDIKHLRRYTLGDVELEREVLALFLGQLPETITALSRAATERDWRIAAHTLKGSGRAVGAWRVARLAEHAERQHSVRNPAMCSEIVARIEEAVEEARAFIASRYPAA
jgi:HPt (histidine-containing phosphotransfer) domain-containing protein